MEFRAADHRLDKNLLNDYLDLDYWWVMESRYLSNARTPN